MVWFNFVIFNPPTIIRLFKRSSAHFVAIKSNQNNWYGLYYSPNLTQKESPRLNSIFKVIINIFEVKSD